MEALGQKEALSLLISPLDLPQYAPRCMMHLRCTSCSNAALRSKTPCTPFNDSLNVGSSAGRLKGIEVSCDLGIAIIDGCLCCCSRTVNAG